MLRELVDVPRLPKSCHQVEYDTAADMKALVLYFDSEEDALNFANWLGSVPRHVGTKLEPGIDEYLPDYGQ